MSKSDISHEGRIVEITPEFTTVEILSVSACASCSAKSLCGLSETATKAVSVPTNPYSDYKVGDEVLVMMKKTLGFKAVWISYVIPLLILMILILSLSPVIGHEIWTALISIAAVAVYYLGIYLFRDRLANDCVFYLKAK